MGSTRSQAEDQMLLAMCMARKIREGSPYDEATFRQCYFETQPANSTESQQVSESWSAAFWDALRHVPADQLVTASKNKSNLLTLVYGVWGKSF